MLLKRYTTFKELVTQNAFVKKRTFFFRSKGFTCLKNKFHYKSSHQRCSERNGVLNNFSKLTGKHLCHSLFFRKKLQASASQKRDSAQVFSCGFCEVFKNTFLRTPLGDCFCHYQKTEPFTKKYLFH